MTAAGKTFGRIGVVAALGGLAGCVAAPPVPIQTPYVAVPGPAKTEAQFREDDTTCRAAAVTLPPGPGVTTPPAAAPTQGTQAAQAPAAQPYQPPGATYLRCMAARNNAIEPLQPQPQPVYAYYASAPIFVGGAYPLGYPWLYGPGLYGAGFYGPGLYGFYGAGFYGGFYGGGFGGYRGYGYRGYGGYGGYYRGGGFDHGGFRGGGFDHGGFRGGGGGFHR